MEFRWEDGFCIAVRATSDEVTISANREGLISLAHHLLALADEPSCAHFHLDEYNSLEDSSCELVIEKIDEPERAYDEKQEPRTQSTADDTTCIPTCLADRIDELLEKPYWVIDLLPSQVPAGSTGQFFSVERWLLDGSHRAALRQSFADVLIKLNCYHDFDVFRSDTGAAMRNPKPQELERLVACGTDTLSIVIVDQGALIQVPTDSTCMSLHNPTPELLERTRRIASAHGLFVWQP